MKYRLKVYSPFGPARGFLTLPLQAEVVTELNEVSTLTLSYNKTIDNSSVTNYLNGDVEIGVEYFDGGWVEPDNHRFMLINEKSDVVSDTPVNNYNFLGLENLFKKVPIYQAGISDSEGNILFSGMNPGEILKLIIDTAQDKGFIPGLSYDFSATRDSDNKAWISVSTVSYPRTAMLSDVIQDLTESGIFDYTLEGRQLRVFNPETALARDRNSVTLFNAFSSSAPTETSYADRLTHMRVIGDNGNEWLFDNNTTSPWGKLEIVSSQSGVPDQPTAYEMSGADLLKGKAPRKTYTKEFEGAPEKEYPFLDYQLGDWVTVQVPDGTFESQRIQTLSITVGGDSEFKWFVSVGDKTEDQISKITKKIRGLSSSATGGSTTRPGGSGSAPSGEFRTPTRPLGFIANPITRADSNGGWAGYISVTWNDDGKAAGPGEFAGTTQPRDRYEIQWWVVGSSASEANTFTASPDVRNATINNVPITDSKGNVITYSLRMRTWGGNSTRSSWTPTVTINMIKDTTPPPVPTDPIINTEPYQIIPSASWDGKFVGDADRPDDFHRVVLELRRVQEDTDPEGVDYSWSQQTYSSQKFDYLLADTIPGRKYQARLGAYDTVENFSGWSNNVEFVAQSVVDADAIREVVEDAQKLIDDTREWAEGRFEEADSRMIQAEQAISTAESNLANVLQILDTTPSGSDFESVVSEVRGAIDSIGDLTQKLSDAEDLIQEKADTSLVNQLNSNLSNLSNDLDAAEGRISSAEGTLSQAAADLVVMGTKLEEAEELIETKAQEGSQALADLNTTLTNSFTQGINAAKIEAATTAEEKAEAAKIAAVNEAASNAQVEYDKLQEAADEALQAAITAAGNLWPDPSFEMGGKGLVANPNWEIVEDSRARHGTHVLRMISNSTVYQRDHLPAENDDYLHCEAWVYRTSVNQTGTVQLRPQRIAVDGTTGSYSTPAFDLANAPVGEWTKVSGVVRLSNNTREISGARLYLQVNGDPAGLLIDSVKYVNVNAAREALSAAQAAQSRADAAHSLAGTAEANAQLAMTAAGQKTRVHYSTSSPSGTASEGDVWRRIDSNGDVYGEWVRVGNSWQSRGIRNEMISNLDVGKLTAGSASLGTAVANKLFADIFAANKITAGMIDVVPNTDEFAPNLESYGDLWILQNAELRDVSLSGGAYTGKAVVFTGNDTAHGRVYGPMRPIIPGRKVFFRGRYSWSGNSNVGETLYAYMEWYDNPDPSTARLGFSTLTTRQSGTSGAIIEGDTVAPPEARFARFYLYQARNSTAPGNALMMDMTCRPMVGSTIIEPGAITTEHLTVTKEMAAALVNADKGNFISLIAADLIANNAVLINAAMSTLTVTEKAKFASAFAETLWTNELIARVVETSQATVSGRNIIADPDFKTLGKADSMWSAPGAVIRTSTNVGPYLDSPMDGTLLNIYYGSLSKPIPANGGETYKLVWRKRRQYAASVENGEYNVNVSYVDYNGNHVSWHGRTHFTSVLNGADCVFQFQVPDDPTIVGMRLYWRVSTTNSGYHGVHSPRLISMADGSMVVENSITADKVVATSEMITKILGADIALVNQMVVNGNLFANHVTAMSAALQNLTVTQKANFADAFASSFMASSAVISELLTSRLVVAADNFAPDPGLVPEAWTLLGADITTNSNSATGNAIRLARRSGDTQVRGPIKPVRPGETIKATVGYVRSGSGNDVGQNAQLRMEWFKDPKGSRVSQTTFLTIPSNSWTQTFEGTVTVPDGITYARFYIYQGSTTASAHSQIRGDMEVRSMLGGQLIVPGTITAEHIVASESLTSKFAQFLTVESDMIAANAITSGKIRAGAVTTAALDANSVTSAKVAANAITANELAANSVTSSQISAGSIDGMTITGSVIQTTSTSSRGMMMSSAGFRAWDNSGNLTLRLNGTDNYMVGRMSTARTGSSVIIEPLTSNDNPGIFFSSNGSASGNNSSIVHDNNWNMVIRGRRTSSSAARQRVEVQGGIYVTDGNVVTTGLGSFQSGLGVSGGHVEAHHKVIVRGWLHNPGAQGTSYSANVYLGGSGGDSGRYFTVSSSIRAVKVNIEPVNSDVPDNILKLEPKVWIDRHELENRLGDNEGIIVDTPEGPKADQGRVDELTADKPLRRVPGLIAEEVRDAGLTEYLMFSEDEETGEEKLSSVAYDRLWTLLIPLVREQRERIEALEAKLESLNIV